MKLLIAFLMMAFSSLNLPAADWSGGLNVRDFGAKGDGVTDDTAAIQRALNFYRSIPDRQLLAKQPMADDLPEFAGHKALSSTGEEVKMPEIFFPAGRYIVSSTLVAGSVFLRGEEGSTIVMTDPEKDLLYGHRGYRSRIEGLTFEGGRRQVLFYTFNEDMTFISVSDCTFRNSSGYALWSHNYRNPQGKDYFTITKGPYSVTWEGDTPILTPEDETLRYYANSTLMNVYDCRFENCAGVADAGTDGMEFRRCEFIMPEDFSGAAIKSGSSERWVKCRGYAPRGGSDKYWFSDTGGMPAIVDCVFECGEDGMSLMRWQAAGRGESYTSLSVIDTDVACGGNPLLVIDNAEQENTPNIIEISGCRNLSGDDAQLVEWVEPFDFERAKKTFFDFSWAIANLDGSYSADFPFLLAFFNNEGFDTSAVPGAIWQNFSPGVPEEILAAVRVDPVSVEWDESAFTTVLKAVDYGVDLETATDDTAAMEKLFAAAREAGGPVKVVMPPAMVTVSETIELPEDLMLDVPGLGSVKQLDRTKPIFSGTGTRRLHVRNMRLVSGSGAFVLDAAADAEVLIVHCLIYQQWGSAFVLSAPEENTACFRLERSMFVSPIQGVVTNFARNDLESIWVSSNGRQDRQAFFENLGGDMRLHGMCGVPMPLKDHGWNHLPFVENWPFSNETRWVDNYGRLDSTYSRYGGEYYGIVPVYNFAADGTVAITGAFFCAAFPDCKNCIVYCEANPAVMVFRDFGWHWKRGVQNAVKYASDDQPSANVWCINFYFEKDSFNAM